MAGAVPAATLPATLTHREATATMAMLAGKIAVAPAGTVHVDASALRQFDTSAVAVLLECRRLAQQAGRTLQLDALPAPLVELARLYGADGLLEGRSGSSSSRPEVVRPSA